jgi:hypothetical protein
LPDFLFDQFSAQLNRTKFVVRNGQFIDASIVPTLIQRNYRDENHKIIAGDAPEEWSENNVGG